jgi:cysteine desulfurase
VPRYLDHNATTPLDPLVLEAMMPYLQSHYANPSGVYRAGRAARAAIDRAREQVAALVGAHPSQVLFTSGGTEANNLAIKGTCAKQSVGTLAVSAIEHASVLEPAAAVTQQGWQLVRLPVSADGVVDVVRLEQILSVHDDLRMMSVMLANNETGVLQPVAACAERAVSRGCVMHSDLTQAVGKIPVSLAALGVQLATLSAHKIYGPKGVGALIYDKSVELESLIHGGGQERELRGGTENVAAIVGFGVAAERALIDLPARTAHTLELRHALETRLRECPQVVVFGAAAARLPNTTYLGVPGIDGETLLMQFDRAGLAVSSGSACDSGTTDPSHVLVAMGVGQALGRSAIRVSFGAQNNLNDVDVFLTTLQSILSRYAS